MNEIVLGLIRHLLTMGGGALVTKGYLDESALPEIVGAILTLIGAAWSIAHKRQIAQNFVKPPPLGKYTLQLLPLSAIGYWLSAIPLALCGVAALALLGCASITQKLRTEIHQTNGVVEIKETSSRAVALWDAKQTLEKLRVSNGKTHSIGLASGEQEASSTNLAGNLESLTRLLQTLH